MTTATPTPVSDGPFASTRLWGFALAGGRDGTACSATTDFGLEAQLRYAMRRRLDAGMPVAAIATYSRAFRIAYAHRQWEDK